MEKKNINTKGLSAVITNTQYVPSYPWTLGTDEIPNPDDLADWD